ncbi:MAG TPA: RNA-binding protein [Paludibacteraceae bacterium]|nr:RNA-binding protein [Paludibacteraceae bacterium]HOU68613.1 RNA-binding protein [Paludibacteraceae bacterium]HPH63223.1 RNA-binding protein [Paludibacteraceae bacterium]HQF50724.1 RNA-binding protein [Paludibacteraceae bacterium]
MNIYVAGLSYAIEDAGLLDLFSAYGEVSSAKVIMDRETGRSRGFGFVEMPNDEEGEKAIEELNGIEHEGKTISVNVARPREDKPRGGSFGNRPRRNFGDNRGNGGFGGGRRY